MPVPPTWRVVSEAAYRAFDAEVRQDMPALAERCEALYLQDPGALQAQLEQARRCGDLKSIEVAAGVLRRHDALGAEGLVSLIRALMVQQRYAEAADALDDPLVRDLGSARIVYARPLALAGSGRFEAALEAADKALLARPGHPSTEALRDRLKLLIVLRGRQDELRDRSEILALLDGYFDFALWEDAAAFLRGLLREEVSAQLKPFTRLRLTEAALQVCPPREVKDYLGLVSDRPKFPERREALAVACDVLTAAAAAHCGAEPSAVSDRGLRIWRALACEAAGDFPNAIRQLSALAEEDKRDGEIRGALARVVGRRVLEQVRPRFAPGGSGRIVNLVVFNDEFALLRMHLEEMAPFVDRFVIVEAGQTFMGARKPLHFQENRDRFDFADRIVHMAIPEFPDELTTAWARDFYQRDMAIAAAEGLCGQDDYLLITDTDEVVDGRALEGFAGDYACLHLVVSRFFLNYRMAPGSRRGSRPAAAIFKARLLMENGISYARFYPARRWSDAYVIGDAGWHFTSVNDADRIALKLDSYAHQEQQKAQFRTPEHFRQILERIRAGELEPGWERVELDERMPAYVRRNQAALADLIL